MKHAVTRLSRRSFLRVAGLGGLAVCSTTRGAPGTPGPSTNWSSAETIVRRIEVPRIRRSSWSVTDFGAKGDGASDARPAFVAAIQRGRVEGGGRVVVPAGVWRLDGPLHLVSGMHLELAANAVLRFTPEPKLYLPPVLTRWEGTEVFNHSPCIYAYQASDVAITGPGTIDGSGGGICTEWRRRQGPDRDRLRQLGAEGVPVHERVFGDGHWLRFGLIQFLGCTRVLLADFTALNSPFWCIHAVASQHVTVRRLRVEGAHLNNDCFDPESSSDVLVEDCDFTSGDDCIAIKSGRDRDGWRLGRPAEDIVIRRCTLASTGAAAIAIGSEMSGGVHNVHVEACRVSRARYGLNFKGNLDRGGTVEHVRVRDVTIDTATEQVIQFSYDYQGLRSGGHPPRFRDFVLEDIRCREALDTGITFAGAPGATLDDLTLRRVTIGTAAKPLVHRQVQRVRFEDVRINGGEIAAPSP